MRLSWWGWPGQTPGCGQKAGACGGLWLVIVCPVGVWVRAIRRHQRRELRRYSGRRVCGQGMGGGASWATDASETPAAALWVSSCIRLSDHEQTAAAESQRRRVIVAYLTHTLCLPDG